jgi:hypothetical protein
MDTPGGTTWKPAPRLLQDADAADKFANKPQAVGAQ